jgi:hypothetical protein
MHFVILIALALVLGVPANGIAVPAMDDCNAASLAVDHGGDCRNASSVSGCGLLCASGSAASAEPANVVAETSSLAPCSRCTFPPAAHSPAPDPAPPKSTTV